MDERNTRHATVEGIPWMSDDSSGYLPPERSPLRVGALPSCSWTQKHRPRTPCNSGASQELSGKERRRTRFGLQGMFVPKKPRVKRNCCRSRDGTTVTEAHGATNSGDSTETTTRSPDASQDAAVGASMKEARTAKDGSRAQGSFGR